MRKTRIDTWGLCGDKPGFLFLPDTPKTDAMERRAKTENKV